MMAVCALALLCLLGSAGAQGQWRNSWFRPSRTSWSDRSSPSSSASGSSAVDASFVARQRATCPFIGSLVAQGLLPVSGSSSNPLASLSDIQRLGNTPDAKGHFGELLAMFATGNHAFYRNRSAVPAGTFSLDFPYSQGSHAGDSDILQRELSSPSFSAGDFQHMASFATDGKLSRTAVGKFIASNVKADPRSTFLTHGSVTGSFRAARDLFFRIVASWFKSSDPQAGRRVASALTRLLAVDNLAGSSGEFALFFSLVQHRTDGRDGSVLYVDELLNAFQNKVLPNGWQNWAKSRVDWAENTADILFHAYSAFARL